MSVVTTDSHMSVVRLCSNYNRTILFSFSFALVLVSRQSAVFLSSQTLFYTVYIMTSAWLGRSNPDANLETLWGKEVFWKDHFIWFKEQGYQLRPRYSPDWIPSWTRTKKFELECEDSYSIPVTFLATSVTVF